MWKPDDVALDDDGANVGERINGIYTAWRAFRLGDEDRRPLDRD